MDIVTKIAPLALALIMLGLGLGLTVKDFKRVLQNPKIFFVGIFSQIVLLPIIAYILLLVIKVPTAIALGVMIIAAAPGGVTSNVMTKFARGDVALSISLTAVCSLISIISVPLIVFSSAKLIGVSNISEEITMTGIALKMAGVVTLPVFIGMIIRKFNENFISNNIKFIERTTGFLFLIVFAAIWIEERNNILSYLSQAGVIVLTLNIVMMIFAYYLAKVFSSNIEQRRCIAIECGLQNGTLAVFVATQIFNDIIYVIPTAAYALIMYITAFIFMYLLRNSN
jgi:BASS family bile acid:Na+ symporter